MADRTDASFVLAWAGGMLACREGNERSAFVAMAVFLRMSGYELEVDADDAERHLIDCVITAHAEITSIADWSKRLLARAG